MKEQKVHKIGLQEAIPQWKLKGLTVLVRLSFLNIYSLLQHSYLTDLTHSGENNAELPYAFTKAFPFLSALLEGVHVTNHHQAQCGAI